MDLKLDTTGDLDLTNNEATLVIENEAIAQHLSIRLKTFLGEWFLDSSIGMPYIQEFFVKNPNRILIQERIKECVIETPGITALNDLSYAFDPITRTLTLTIDAQLESGSSFVFTYSELVIGD